MTAMKNLKSIFWFGIFELFEASICLLSIQIGQFSRDFCDCESPNLLRINSDTSENSDYTSTSIIEIGAKLRKDKLLYNKALVLFLT